MKENMWRIRLSILWVADVIALAAAFTLTMFEPGYLDDILSGQLEGMEISVGVILLASFFWLVPLFMMYLSLVMKPSVIRVLTILLGLLLGLLNLIDFLGGLATFEVLGFARSIMIAMMTIIPFVIAWHGWKWPQEKEL